jgi:hypothetical protein
MTILTAFINYYLADQSSLTKFPIKVMPLKSNRKVALAQAAKARGPYVAVSELELPAETNCEVWLEEVSFPYF